MRPTASWIASTQTHSSAFSGAILCMLEGGKLTLARERLVNIIAMVPVVECD